SLDEITSPVKNSVCENMGNSSELPEAPSLELDAPQHPHGNESEGAVIFSKHQHNEQGSVPHAETLQSSTGGSSMEVPHGNQCEDGAIPGGNKNELGKAAITRLAHLDETEPAEPIEAEAEGHESPHKERGRPRIPDEEKINNGKRHQSHRSRPRIVVPKIEPEPSQKQEDTPGVSGVPGVVAPEDTAESKKPLRATFAGRIAPSTSDGKEFFEHLKAIHMEHAPPKCRSEKMQRQLWKHVKEAAGFGCGKSEMKVLCLQFFKAHEG
ncbi:unnamed protein product, partial [Durusdinium trenchii]